LRSLALVGGAHAQVTLAPAERVSFEPHPVHDTQEFPDLAALSGAQAARLVGAPLLAVP
jgi:hypothetical protein